MVFGVTSGQTLRLILYPTDFSKESGIPLACAVAVARAFAAEIEVFHVELDPSEESPLAESLFPVRMVFESLRADTADHLRRVTDQIRRAGVACRSASEFGRSAMSIVERARRIDAGLIVVGKHTKRMYRSVLLGPVAERVIEHSPCPVLVVPLPPE
jgi:nucleotide-binding universal stress UspA family protein